jgi:penicillin amidase
VTFDRAVEAPARKKAAPPRKRVSERARTSPLRPSTRRIINAVAAAVVSAAVLYAAFFPTGPLPPLGTAFNPVTGVWTMAADGQVSSQKLRVAGLQQPVQVTFERDGTAHIVARTDHDLFLTTGYVHARFRLFQMDLMRRQGQGRLSEIVGKAALDTDRFELQLGLMRTAQAEWDALAADSPSRLAMSAYAQGVNDRIEEAKSSHQLDAMFTFLGYEPKPWTPIDTLIIKGDMTQTLNFTDTPLVVALLNKSLGKDLTSEWLPVLPPNPQSPYYPGPYGAASIAPIQTMRSVSDAEAETATALYQRLAALPPGLISKGGASNNWAVAPAKSTTGGALLAGDPHLHLTLPSIWFQMTQDSPGFHVSGVAIPGTPGVLIGHNEHIAWSLTDAQNQQTFFYQEKEDAAHPNQYFWKDGWNTYKTITYDIPVLHAPTEHLKVKLSAHGPVISERGMTTSVWWAGNIPSQDFDVLMRVGQASDWKGFREALRGWYSPTHNFVYADDRGHIGMISAGYYPQVPAAAQPWLPMPGTGEFDVNGTIPYNDIPQVFDPPAGFIWSANQRQVTGDYPYYIGSASNFFDPGYRANEIKRVLSQPGKLSAGDMMALQMDTRDFLASEIVPALLQSLAGEKLTPKETVAKEMLAAWDYRMETDSQAASIWWTFWESYLSETFDPWWKSRAVPVSRQALDQPLGQALEAWTLKDPTNRAFSAPGVGSRTATDAQRKAFHKTVSSLLSKLGQDPKTWKWGRINTRYIENLALIKGISYGPRADRGDAFTPLAAGVKSDRGEAYGPLLAQGSPSTLGPSWRMVVDWGTRAFSGIYPGGQSENPASEWYTNRVENWWAGSYAPMLNADEALTSAGAKMWTLQS